ncbi:MAG: dioxygenase [Rickettsiaceae bacterium]
MNILKQFVIYLTIFTTYSVNASNPRVSDFDFCNVTPVTINNYEPEKFETSNNLLNKAGQEPIICGEKIIIYGTVLDQHCVPVSDAKVYIWQTDCHGKYPYTPLKNRIDKKLINIDSEFTFTGNGTATTNNNGEFVFITTAPPKMNGLAPQINIRVEHYIMGSLQSSLTISNKHSTRDVFNTNSGKAYTYEIVLPGHNTLEHLNHFNTK